MNAPVLYAAPLWRRILSNHNPLYLVSAWLVLHGIGQAFQGEVGLRFVPLMTQLLCAYTLALALSGWLVVRIGRIWDDARMILLVVLLMFTALSTSYDDLCLKDPATGALHLGFGFGFSCAVTEIVLFALGMKLPLRYRLPFYLQLAVLFAFPALLGKFSVEGRDPAMCAGVLLFPVIAGAALLTLWPAAASRPLHENGTPWPWPLYPWSIFVFVAIASAIRAWMLSVSFSPAAGTSPSFMPYLFCPILLAMLFLGLELGLRHQSKLTQRVSLFGMIAVIWMSFPGERINDAQRILLRLMETYVASPPLVVCAAIAVIAAYAIARRAAGAEFVAFAATFLLAFIGRHTRSMETMIAPNEVVIMALIAWQLGNGLWKQSTPRLAFAGIALAGVIGRHYQWNWLFAHNAFWLVQLAILWCLVLPLYCRDAIGRAFRAVGQSTIALVATVLLIESSSIWRTAPRWELAAVATAMIAIAVLYWAILHVRWYVVTVAWTTTLAVIAWTLVGLGSVESMQLRRGLMYYALGCFLLGVALVVSCWKAGLVLRGLVWLQSMSAPPPGTATPVSSNSS